MRAVAGTIGGARGWAIARRVARATRRAVRAGLVAAMVALVAVVQVTLAAVWLWPAPSTAPGGELAPRGGVLTLVDRRGEVIATVPTGAPDRDHWVPLAEIPAVAVAAVIASEDHRFWDHRGVDGLGLARAAWLDLRGGALAYGGSTLTMQLARMIRGTTTARTGWNKAGDTLYALRLERALSKREILEQWFNRAYFGHGAHGIDAAARRYFGRPVRALSTGEAVLLAVLPRAPGAYDPLRHLDRARARRDRVLARLVARGELSAHDALVARATPLAPRLHEPASDALHFVRHVLDQVPPAQRAAGGVVRTTLDLRLQRRLERRLAEHVAGLAGRNVDQAGVVVLDTATSEVLAMVGSAAWDGEAGQINITTRRRHPGSALKPFVYAAALEAGDHPASIAWDVADATPGYFVAGEPPERGPVRYREALASSYNFAAVWTLERAGVARVMTVLRQAGVAELSGAPDSYGLRLALGAPKVRLLDLAAGYGVFVRGGRARAPRAVIDVTALDGARWRPESAPDARVLSPTTAWLVMDMLADPEARRAGFGHELPLDLPWPVAAKTGTARGFADTVTVAATEQVIVAAWGGTFDGTPTQGVVAMTGAAPLARDALLVVADGRPLTLPARPDGVDDVEVCALSGALAGPACPRKHEHVTRGHGPTHACDWHQPAADGRVAVRWPAEADGWLERVRARGQRP